ncbi:hypothetical protein AA309_07170 [Microvirga vignae]|uniref:Peptidase M15A C-terminal domain-containing protein n=1 Tax=Microvirga vignae TaxID=1225564 RepID=A0A0H1RF79_9HYPH|nr:hypothetical protein AA309_07170 [Microvirga vignae]
MTITITEDDIEALARTSMSEVGHFGRYGEETLKGGVKAVVDTILNRVAHPNFPDTIDEVVNARFQFSAIGGPGGVRTWRRLPRASDAVFSIVTKHLASRVSGSKSTVGGATHFLNPFLSSARALSTWGNHVVANAVASWGRGRDIHFHGFAPGTAPSPAYNVALNSAEKDSTGKGMTLIAAALGNPAGLAGQAGVDAPGTGSAPERDKTKAKQSGKDQDVGVFIEEENNNEDGIVAYHVEEVPLSEVTSLQTTLNRLAAEGWRMRQILPVQEKLLAIFEGDDLDRNVHESDDRSDDDEVHAPAVITDTTPEGRFVKFLSGLNLQHFQPQEFLVLGAQNLSGPAKGKNTLPPEDLWNNIVPTAKVLDVLRRRLGDKVRLSSVYRSPAYNALIPGAAGGSTHMQFRAADFSCADGLGSVWWAKQLSDLRDAGLFMGGIGVYPTFVHIDTRGQNVEFGPWKRRVFG